MAWDFHFLSNALWSLQAGTAPLELSGPGRPGRVGGSPPHRPPPSAWLCEPHSQQQRLEPSTCHKQEIPLKPLCVFIWAPLGAIWLLSPRWESAANYATCTRHTAALSPQFLPPRPCPCPPPCPEVVAPKPQGSLGTWRKRESVQWAWGLGGSEGLPWNPQTSRSSLIHPRPHTFVLSLL